VYVPAGWFDAGSTECGASPRRLWVDGFVIQRAPVTNRAYLDFLHDLVARGRTEEALHHAPRERSGTPGEPGALLLGFDGARFHLRPDAQGDVWGADWPVVMIDWHGAMAYAAWKAKGSGLPWRLPSEFEWEKASRGTDGRRHPWGEHIDPSWTHIAGSRPGRSMPAPVDSYPADVSVYGVRGLGGNVQDWCLERFDAPLPADGERVVPQVPTTEGDPLLMARGGGWDTTKLATRCAARTRAVASYRSWQRGFRLVRSYPG
jgi:serine/threonine-protein kinase